jgi:hypothetical protein
VVPMSMNSDEPSGMLAATRAMRSFSLSCITCGRCRRC